MAFAHKKIMNYELSIKNIKGFTLIELIIVIAIIALIATAAMAVLNPFGQFQKARDSRVKSDLSQVQKALESYYQDKGNYPSSTAAYKMLDGTTTINWNSSWQPYMNVVPQSPSSGHTYVYYSPNGQTYYIYANLGRGAADPQSCNNGNACTSLSGYGISATACGGTCNFGVSSPNVSP